MCLDKVLLVVVYIAILQVSVQGLSSDGFPFSFIEKVSQHVLLLFVLLLIQLSLYIKL